MEQKQLKLVDTVCVRCEIAFYILKSTLVFACEFVALDGRSSLALCKVQPIFLKLANLIKMIAAEHKSRKHREVHKSLTSHTAPHFRFYCVLLHYIKAFKVYPPLV